MKNLILILSVILIATASCTKSKNQPSPIIKTIDTVAGTTLKVYSATSSTSGLETVILTKKYFSATKFYIIADVTYSINDTNHILAYDQSNLLTFAISNNTYNGFQTMNTTIVPGNVEERQFQPINDSGNIFVYYLIRKTNSGTSSDTLITITGN